MYGRVCVYVCVQEVKQNDSVGAETKGMGCQLPKPIRSF